MTVTAPANSSAVSAEQFWAPVRSGRTSIDLFSGSGGLSLGLHTQGWEGVFAVEKDGMAFETLTRNLIDASSPFAGFHDWPDWLPVAPTDMNELTADRRLVRKLRSFRGEIDLVAGGPPCQGFSVGGARRGEDDPRNDLPYRFVDFVDLVQPRLVLLENVEGFDKPFSHQGHATSYADDIQAEFEGIGYTTIKLLIHAVDFGVPQTRRRVILFGVRGQVDRDELLLSFKLLLKHYALEFKRQWLPNTTFPVSARDAIGDLCGTDFVPTPDAPRFMSSRYLPSHSEYSDLMRAFIEPDALPDSHRYARHTDKVLTLFRAAQSTQRPGRLPRAFLQEMGTESRKKFLLDPGAPVSTLTSHPDEFIHFAEPRIITLREAARFQSFPDAFTFHGRYTLNGDRRGLDVSRCAQIGNAIPPLVGRGLGFAAERVLEDPTTDGLKRIVSQLRDLDDEHVQLELVR